MKPWISCSLALALGLIAQAAAAQPPARGEANRRNQGSKAATDETRALLEQVLAARLTSELNLSDKATVVMLRRVREYRQHIRDLAEERAVHTKALRNAMTTGDDNAIEEHLTRIFDIEEEINKARRELFESTRGELTPRQRARIFLSMHDFESGMRRLIELARARAAGNQRGNTDNTGTTAPTEADPGEH